MTEIVTGTGKEGQTGPEIKKETHRAGRGTGIETGNTKGAGAGGYTCTCMYCMYAHVVDAHSSHKDLAATFNLVHRYCAC